MDAKSALDDLAIFEQCIGIGQRVERKACFLTWAP